MLLSLRIITVSPRGTSRLESKFRLLCAGFDSEPSAIMQLRSSDAAKYAQDSRDPYMTLVS
jgi:hypothetical protein